MPARSAYVSPKAAVVSRRRAARKASNCVRGRRHSVRRGERPCARQHAGRLGHGPQSLLENLTQISGRPAGSGRCRQLMLVRPAGQVACSRSQSNWKSSSAKPFRARLPLVVGPRRPAQSDRVIVVRGDDLGRVEGAGVHELHRGEQVAPVERLVDQRQRRRVDDRRGRRLDVGDEARQVVVAGLGDVDRVG